MVFNGDSDNQDIVSLVSDATGISKTAELQQITRAANEANKRIWFWIFDAYGGWVFDGSGHNDLPTSTADLVQGQSKYTLPDEALTVRGVEVKNTGGVWHKMELLTEEYLRQYYSEKEFQDESSEPQWYTPYAGLIKLHPAPDYAQNSSLRVSYDRSMVNFASTDTTKTPGFASQFHEAVAIGASYYIAANKGLNNVSVLLERWGEMPEGAAERGYKKAIKEFYSQRLTEQDTVIDQGRHRVVREMI